jgi:hypothetical protein
LAKGKIVGLVFGLVALIASIIVISNGMRNVQDAEEWVAYEYGECRFDGFSEEECLEMAGPVSWPAINGAQAFEKYYGEGKAEWVYGENPRLGLGPLG